MQTIVISSREAKATAHLLRTVLHSGHPVAHQLVGLACPSFQDVKAVTRLCERLEAIGLGKDADEQGRAA